MAFEYTADPSFDYTIDEKGNTFIALRKIDWGNKGDFKLDLRKYYASESGETMSKGLSFLTDDGPNELTKVLIETGYGNPEEITNAIVYNRPDILRKMCKVISSDPTLSDPDFINDEDEETFYDPEELMS